MNRYPLAASLCVLISLFMSPLANGSELTDKQVDELCELIRPTAAESAFLTIPWETSIHAARVKAAREGKPMLLFMIHGHLLSGV